MISRERERERDDYQQLLDYHRAERDRSYDGKIVTNYHPVVGWLAQLGQPLYGRVTPDGYALTEAAWTSSGRKDSACSAARSGSGR